MKALATMLLLCVLFFMKLSGASPNGNDVPYVCAPQAAANGTVYTDNYASALYIRTADGTTRELAASPGSGMYFTLSPDRSRIGFKYIGADGMQSPAVIDLLTGSMRLLEEPSRLAGQVSFTRDGDAAYTLGTTLVVMKGGARRAYDLGTYANIAPVSPDGRSAVYNDANDRLILIDLDTGAKTRLTDSQGGYFQPQWSSDNAHILYSSLSGSLFIYDRVSSATAAIGEGYAPRWSDDGREIAFYKKEIANGELVNTDLYCASADGAIVRRITQTPDVCEMDPSFVPGARELLFQTYKKSGIGAMAAPDPADADVITRREGSTAQATALDATRAFRTGQTAPRVTSVSVTPHFTDMPSHSTSALDVPYINQVYDTPDWFNGHSACGPTTAMMALAYYKILPPWPVTCTWPSPHTSNWGMYISDIYWYNGIFYNLSAKDPNERLAQGAFGYIWGAGSPHTRLSGYYKNHGILSETFDAPSHASAVGEIGAGNLYSICNGLTTAGHIVQAHGVDAAESHSIIVNDPYGNKNEPGYPNNFGKNAKYDWPGYNNGNQNFNTVFWASTVHYTAPAEADSIVDDSHLYHGFTLAVKPGLSMSLWKEKPVGYKGHFWYAFTTYSDSIDSCYATWRPTLEKAGRYEIFASLPYYKGTFASVARYKIYANDGLHVVTLNQEIVKSKTADTLVSLGTFVFDQGKTGYVRLGDATGIKSEALIFDALLWKYRGEAVTSVQGGEAVPASFALRQNYPNPFNPSTTITYMLPSSAHVTLSVTDVLGRECARLVEGAVSEGVHRAVWNADAFPAGIYFCRLTAAAIAGKSGESFSEIKKMLLVK